MRTYKIEYWAEYNDCCENFQEIVMAEDIEQAIQEFKEMGIIYKRIFSVIEQVIPIEI